MIVWVLNKPPGWPVFLKAKTKLNVKIIIQKLNFGKDILAVVRAVKWMFTIERFPV